MAHGDRSVDVFIRKLRQKLERGSPSWSYIHTHFGIGYRFDPESSVEGADAPSPAVGEADGPEPGPIDQREAFEGTGTGEEPVASPERG
jgi:DNA-binding winged helix-turn-helix (wHTH) protein